MKFVEKGRNMVRHSARVRFRSFAPRAIVALLLAGALGAQALETPKPDDKDPKKAADKDKNKDKGKGPEHNVSLMEEPRVNDLFNRAAKARARAENERSLARCVAYAEILKKFPNTLPRQVGRPQP
jgi:hypothetical protein